MIALVLRLLLSTWLFVSAFALAHSTASAWNALIVACLVATISFLAFAMPGRPGLRWWNAVLATWLLASTMLLPYVALGTVFHDVAMAMLIAASTFFLPAPWLLHWHREHSATTR